MSAGFKVAVSRGVCGTDTGGDFLWFHVNLFKQIRGEGQILVQVLLLFKRFTRVPSLQVSKQMRGACPILVEVRLLFKRLKKVLSLQVSCAHRRPRKVSNCVEVKAR